MIYTCVDASVIVKFITPEEDSLLAESLFKRWKTESVEIIIPSFALAEVGSVLRQKIMRNQLDQDVAEKAFRFALDIPLRSVELERSHWLRAWELSSAFQLRTIYDAVYIALAESRQCEFWTADHILYQNTKSKIPLVRYLRS